MMQKYKSHKIVDAGKITRLRATRVGDHSVINLIEVGGRQFNVEPSFTARGEPSIGDYAVLYDAGTDREYLSWSPAAVFEAGYTLIEEVTGATVSQIEDAINRGEHVNIRPDGGVEMTNAAQVQRPCDTEDDVQQDGSVDAGEVGAKE